MDKNVYPWDFRDISRRAYLIRNGIYVDSSYTDCLIEEYIDGFTWRHQWHLSGIPLHTLNTIFAVS